MPGNKKIDWLDILYSILLGLVFTHLIIGLDKLNPIFTRWLMLPGSDFSYHYLAWEYFKDTPWTWPVGKIEGYAYPMHNSILYTDSIPLLALLFKAFNFLLPPDFQYFGIWHACCYLLNGFFGVWICKTIGYNRIISWLGAIFFTGAVVLVARFGHAALCGQWVLLWALLIHLNRSSWSLKIILINLLLLTFLSSLIHPYLLFMILGLNAATLYQLYKDSIIKIKPALIILTSFPGIVVLSWYACGAFLFKGQLSEGLGKFSANLNTFINAWDVGSLGPTFKFYGDGQGEGIGYLGLGILFLCLVILINKIINNKPPAFKPTRIRFNWFFIACILFFVFALSPKWAIGNQLLIDWKYNDYISRTFRGTGRFIWPLYYFIFYWTLLQLYKIKTHKYTLTCLIGFALCLQAIDLRPLWKRNPFVDIAPPPLAFENEMRTIISRAEKIITYPPYAATLADFCDYIYFVNMAQHFNKPVTTGYGARFPEVIGKKFKEQLNAFDTYFEKNPRDILISHADSLQLHKTLIAEIGGLSYHFDRYRIFVPDTLNIPDIAPSVYKNIEKQYSMNLADYLMKYRSEIIAGVIQQEGRGNLGKASLDYFRSLGSKIDSVQFGGSWSFLINKGHLTHENYSNQISIRDSFEFRCDQTSYPITVYSGTHLSGLNESSIKQKDTEYSLQRRGINLVVFDTCGTILDKVNFDSYLSDQFYYR